MNSCIMRICAAGLMCVASLTVASAEPTLGTGNAAPNGEVSGIVDIPTQEPQDYVMAAPDEVRQMHDWAAAAFVGTAGTGQPHGLLDAAIPFSFQYAGLPSAEAMKHWTRSDEVTSEKDCQQRTVTWADPATKLEVQAVVRAWKRYPAVDWVLYFKNAGTQDSPILEDIQALDVRLAAGSAHQRTVLHQILGDVCGERSYLPQETVLEAGRRFGLAPGGGRSSNGTFPFFNLQSADQGVITAVGWSGQWAASLDRGKEGVTRLQAGMEKTHLVLHAGEQIRSPGGGRSRSRLPRSVSTATTGGRRRVGPLRRARSRPSSSPKTWDAIPIGSTRAGSSAGSPTASATGSPGRRSFRTA